MAIHLSASLIKDYLSCRKQAQYRLEKVETTSETKESVIGNIVHSAIETFWDDDRNGINYVKDRVNNELGGDSHLTETALACMGNFYNNFSHMLSSEDKIEHRFKIPIDSSTYIVGKMDRVSFGNVFDWKTSKESPISIARDPQFILYYWAYKRLYNAVPSGVYLVSLQNNKVVRYFNDVSATDSLFGVIIPEIVSAIKKGYFPRTGLFTRSCARCQYSKICSEEGLHHVMDSATPIKE